MLPRANYPGPGRANYPGPGRLSPGGTSPGPGAACQPPHLMPDETGHDHLRLWIDTIFTAPSHQPPDGVAFRDGNVMMARVPNKRDY